jgi:hypothetical protein
VADASVIGGSLKTCQLVDSLQPQTQKKNHADDDEATADAGRLIAVSAI